jgi:predicted NodU family carbamoyl transferase
MADEETTSVTEEAVAQPTETEQTQDVQKEEVQEEKPSPRSDVEYNWREARRKMDTLEQRNYELEAKLNQLSSANKPPPEEDDISKLNDDDIVTAKQARNLAQRMAKQVAEETIRNREAQTLDERLQAKFPDFTQVVNKENIDLFRMQEPDLANALYAMQNSPYEQATAAYKMLKKYGLGETTEMTINKKKALENSKKPVSVQTVTKSSSAIGNAHLFENGLTPELQAHLRKEMAESRKKL